MSNTPPTIGQDPWGADLNEYFSYLENRITNAVNDITALAGRVDAIDTNLAQLDGRVDAVEARPEHFYNSYAWQYSNQAPPPTGNQVRFDNANLSIATQAVFRVIDSDGADRKNVFQSLNAGSFLRINDWDDAANIHRFNITGPATIGATDATFPVAWISGSGTIPNAKVNVAFIIPVVL